MTSTKQLARALIAPARVTSVSPFTARLLDGSDVPVEHQAAGLILAVGDEVLLVYTGSSYLAVDKLGGSTAAIGGATPPDVIGARFTKRDTSSSATSTVATPSGWVLGDHLIALLSQDEDGTLAACSLPAGFTSVASLELPDGGAGRIGYLQPSSAPAANYSFGVSTAADTVCQLVLVRGAQDGSPFRVAPTIVGGETVNSISHTIATIDAVSSDLLLGWFARDPGGNAERYLDTPPEGMTLVQRTSSTSFATAALFRQALEATGATGGRTATYTTSSSIRHQLGALMLLAPKIVAGGTGIEPAGHSHEGTYSLAAHNHPGEVYLGRVQGTGASGTISLPLPTEYDDFKIRVRHNQTASGVVGATLQLNNDGTAAYDHLRLTGDGSVAASTYNISGTGAFFYTGGSPSTAVFEIIGRSLTVVGIVGTSRSRVTSTPTQNRIIHQVTEYGAGPATSVQLVTAANSWSASTYMDLYGIRKVGS